MSGDFQTKKISQETLGEYLYCIRVQLGFTIEEVAHQTGVFEKFIAGLETGRYEQLPPEVYVQGFLKKIAELYKVSYSELLTQYKKEKGISEQTTHLPVIEPNGFVAWVKELSITPKLITIVTGAVLGMGGFVYILAQVFSVNRTPSLVIMSPNSTTVLQGSSVDIAGQTDPGISLTVNGQTVLVDPDGKFKTTLSVTPGQKDFRLIATNKFGKEKVELLSLKIDEPQVAGQVTNRPADLQLELKFTKSTTISIRQDGVSLPEEIVPSGAIKKIVASESIEVTTSDAGNTQAIFNGQNLGALGKIGESITVPFTHEAEEWIQSQNISNDQEVQQGQNTEAGRLEKNN